MRLAFVTDIHLNFLPRPIREAADALVGVIETEKPDALLITGDLHEATDDGTFKTLEWIARKFGKPVYFVLGNHDFFGSHIGTVRRAAAELETRVGSKALHCKHLRYLTSQTEPIVLSSDVALIGHDGWGDGSAGSIDGELKLNDHKDILDFAKLTERERIFKMIELGEEAATHIWAQLHKAIPRYGRVIMALHMPPFREACRHKGLPCADERWLPHLVCKAVGDVVMTFMRDNPEKQLEIYCGHTHEAAFYQPLPNLKVTVGAAAYETLSMPHIIEV